MPESAMGVLVVVVTGVTAILPLPQGLQGRRERESFLALALLSSSLGALGSKRAQSP